MLSVSGFKKYFSFIQWAKSSKKQSIGVYF